MHHAQIAQRAFDTPLMIAPAKALAFLSGLGPRITGQEIRFDAMGTAEPDLTAARQTARASLIGGDLVGRHGADGDAPFPVIDGVAVIAISGTLVHRGAWIGQSSGLTSYEGLAAQIDAAVHDKAIRGIALEIDSFGGEVAGAFDLSDRIRAAQNTKPVHAFLAEHALSAGYALASQATRITLPRTGAAGSIGVITMHTDMSGMLAQKGVAVTLIHAWMMHGASWPSGVTTTTRSGRTRPSPTRRHSKRAGRLSNLRAPRPARLRQTGKPNTQIQPADSRYE